MIYTMKNKDTGEISDYTMRLTEYDDFLINNPHLERYHTYGNIPGLGDGARMNTPGIGRADSTFEKYVIQRIKDTVPGNTLGKTHKTKTQREW